jgi:soluble lytic murein transglycosylase
MQGLRKRSPLSYYGALVFDLLGEPYDPEISTGPYVAPIMWLQLRLAVLDKFQLAGLELATEAMVGGLIDSVEGSVGGSLLLAESLIERGFTIEGINLGWKLLGDGMEMSRRLALILYPFPYKDIVYNEALEYGADPILLAAVIRQESAFTPAIRSPVGAIGLMQVMPTTGAEIAKNLGFIGFTTSSLETPEINLHLGTRYLLEMKDRYGEVGLPLVLSAYNAGPTRARRWRDSLDSKDALRFTERIPFEETRGYVKNVVRNIHIYKFLYESPGSGVN